MSCPDCACSCIIADQSGVPYAAGVDQDGNAAIIVPAVENVGCGIIEFFHEAANCIQCGYRTQFPAAAELVSGTIVLGFADDADVTVDLIIGSVVAGTATVTAGQTTGSWSGGTFPRTVPQGTEVRTEITASGAQAPPINMAVLACLGVAPETLSVTLGAALAIPSSGSLSPGQTPASIGLTALAANIGSIFRFDGSGRATSLWTVLLDSDGTTVRWGQLQVS